MADVVGDVGTTVDTSAALSAALESLGTLQSLIEAREEAAKKTVEAAGLMASETKKRALEEAALVYAEIAKKRKEHEDQERAIMATKTFEKRIIKLNIGGALFTTSLTTLRRFPSSVLGAMFSGRHDVPETDDGAFFIDRDGSVFNHILNYLRAPEKFHMDLVAKTDVRLFLQEIDFYGLATPDTPFGYLWISHNCPGKRYVLRGGHIPCDLTVSVAHNGDVYIDGIPSYYDRPFKVFFFHGIVHIALSELTKRTDSLGRPWPETAWKPNETKRLRPL